MTEEHGHANKASSGTTVDSDKSIGADSKRSAISVGEPRWLFSA